MNLEQLLTDLKEHAVVLDEKGQLLAISGTAQRILSLENLPAAKDEVLSSLVNIARHAETDRLHKLTLRTGDGRLLPVIATSVRASDRSGAQTLIKFYETSQTDAVIETVRRTNRLRALLVLACAAGSESLSPLAVQSLRKHVPDISSKFYESLLIKQQQSVATDFQRNVSLATDIAHQLISPTIRIAITRPNAVLLNADRALFIRLVSHIILEASDFVGSAGSINLDSELIDADTLLLRCSAKRESTQTIAGHPLERYFLWQLYPQYYSVRIVSDDSEPNSTIPGSINLKITQSLAEQCGAKITLGEITASSMELSVMLPLLKGPKL